MYRDYKGVMRLCSCTEIGLSAASKLLYVSGAYGQCAVIPYMADVDLSLMELISVIERGC